MNSQEKPPSKSINWIASRIQIAIVLFGFVYLWLINPLRSFVYSVFEQVKIAQVIMFFILWGLSVVPVWIGIKYVLKRTTIKKEDVTKISIRIILVFLVLFLFLRLFEFSIIGIMYDILSLMFLFCITYYFLTRVTKPKGLSQRL